MITITWPQTSTKHTTLAHTVYLKENWDDAWTEESNLWALAASWKAAPAFPVATLGVRRYGRGILPLTTWWQLVERLTKNRWFVKIAFQTHTLTAADDAPGASDPEQPETLDWYGILEVDQDRILGSRQTPDGKDAYESGEQTFTAYGLERLLHAHTIDSHTWRSTSTGNTETVDIAPDFNANARGNRSTTEADGAYVFTDVVTEPDEEWTTREIVRYLLAYQTPRDASGNRTLEITLDDDDDQLPDWDQPVVPQYNRTTHAVLSELVTASRLTGWRLAVTAAEAPETKDTVTLQPFTYVADKLTLDTGLSGAADDQVACNPRVLTLDYEGDPDATSEIHADSSQQVDQVIYRGARRVSVCSLSFYDDGLQAGWPGSADSPDLQSEYDAGASSDANYPAAAQIAERQRADAEARASDRLQHVYSRFRIPDDWHGLAGGGFYNGGALRPVFPLDDDEFTNYPYNPRELFVMRDTPLLDGYDYEGFSAGNPQPYTDGPWARRPPVVFAPLPIDAAEDPVDRRWVQLDRNAAAAGVEVVDDSESRTWSATVDVPDADRAVVVRVHGAPQHAIAYDNFTPQSHETELKWGEYDYEDFVFLVALQDQRYCEARHPADEDLDTDLTFVRRHIVDAGDEYRLDYLVPGTFVRIDQDSRTPVQSSGGFIRDNRFQLAAMARTAFEYLGTERRVLTLETHRITAAVQVGDYIAEVGNTNTHTVASVVTSIEITVDQADGPAAGPSTMQIRTAYVDRATFAVV